MCKLLLNSTLVFLLGYWFWQTGTLLEKNEESDEEYNTPRSEENVEHRVSSEQVIIIQNQGRATVVGYNFTLRKLNK